MHQASEGSHRVPNAPLLVLELGSRGRPIYVLQSRGLDPAAWVTSEKEQGDGRQYFHRVPSNSIRFIDPPDARDRKSTRLNSSHQIISYAVFCLKKKKKKITEIERIEIHVCIEY